MGSIARLLSLSALSNALGKQTADMVFDACRGIDKELVKSTSSALAKSITAFKSFPRSNLAGLEKWILLLVADLVARVELDSHRNHRYPKSCTIQYYYVEEGESNEYIFCLDYHNRIDLNLHCNILSLFCFFPNEQVTE